MRALRPLAVLGTLGRGLCSLAPVAFGADKALPGLVGGPKGAPAVIVIQEWWGITDGIKVTASKLAEEGGYRVLVPDIYKGKIGVNAEEAHHLMSNLDFPKAIEEISAAAAHLKAEGAPSVGVVGFCMGGALTMGALAASKDISCGGTVRSGSNAEARLDASPQTSHRRPRLPSPLLSTWCSGHLPMPPPRWQRPSTASTSASSTSQRSSPPSRSRATLAPRTRWRGSQTSPRR